MSLEFFSTWLFIKKVKIRNCSQKGVEWGGVLQSWLNICVGTLGIMKWHVCGHTAPMVHFNLQKWFSCIFLFLSRLPPPHFAPSCSGRVYRPSQTKFGQLDRPLQGGMEPHAAKLDWIHPLYVCVSLGNVDGLCSIGLLALYTRNMWKTEKLKFLWLKKKTYKNFNGISISTGWHPWMHNLMKCLRLHLYFPFPWTAQLS